MGKQQPPPPTPPPPPALTAPSAPSPPSPLDQNINHRVSDSIPLWQVLAQEYEAVHDELPCGFGTNAAAIREERGKSPQTCETMQADNKKYLPLRYGAIHRATNSTSALCLSGGGIRSATFNLGLLQVFAKRGLLDIFHYLSTVSGGGFIGGWLSAWIHWEHKRSVIDGLAGEVPQPPNPLEPEPAPIRHLRQYSNYLSPKLGLLSADTWTLFAIFCRNLLLNWLILIPFFAAVLMIPRFAVRGFSSIDRNWLSAQLSWLLPIGTICLIWAISYMDRNRPACAIFIWV